MNSRQVNGKLSLSSSVSATAGGQPTAYPDSVEGQCGRGVARLADYAASNWMSFWMASSAPVIGSLDLGGRRGGLRWPMRKPRVGQRATDALVEPDEQGSHSRSFFREPVAVTPAIALQPPLALPFRSS